jgi:hypothetical protein
VPVLLEDRLLLGLVQRAAELGLPVLDLRQDVVGQLVDDVVLLRGR